MLNIKKIFFLTSMYTSMNSKYILYLVMPQIGLQGMDCLKNQLETKRRINAFGPGCLGFLPRPLQSPYSSLNPL